MTTGEKIRAARQKAGLTQKQLGELCGIAEPTIRRYELGKLNPKPQTLLKIANPLGLHYSDLYGDTVFIDENGGFSIQFNGGTRKNEAVSLLNELAKTIKDFDGEKITQNDMAQIFQEITMKQGHRQYEIVLLPRQDAPQSPPPPTDTTPPLDGTEGAQEGE